MDTQPSMVARLIESAFEKTIEGDRWVYKVADRLYVMLERNTSIRLSSDQQRIAVWCAPCRGGSYNCIGTISTESDSISFSLKTREGILNSRSEYEELSLYIADPEFCSKLLGIIAQHAALVLKACGDAHNASWRRYNERFAK